MPETNNITDSLVDLDEQSEAEKLLCEIDEFRERTGMPETTFGSKAVNNPKFVPRLRRGLDPRISTVAKVRQFMAGAGQ